MNSSFNIESLFNSLIFLIPIIVLIFYFLLRKKKIENLDVENEKSIFLFSGNEPEIAYLKGILKENGINSFTKNDFQSGTIAGFSGGLPTLIDLFIFEKDFIEAEKILKDFTTNK